MTVEHDEEDAARARAIRRLRTRGLEAAVNALIDLAEDRSAPANSRAAAASALARGNGLYATTGNEPRKALHEMSAEELKREADEIERERREFLALMEAGAEGSGDVFE